MPTQPNLIQQVETIGNKLSLKQSYAMKGLLTTILNYTQKSTGNQFSYEAVP